MNLKDFIKELNELKVKQTSIFWIEDLPEKYWEIFIPDKVKVENLLPSKSRWYEMATDVYGLYGGFIGVDVISDIKGNTYVNDLSNILEFYEMEEIKTVTYKAKK